MPSVRVVIQSIILVFLVNIAWPVHSGELPLVGDEQLDDVVLSDPRCYLQWDYRCRYTCRDLGWGTAARGSINFCFRCDLDCEEMERGLSRDETSFASGNILIHSDNQLPQIVRQVANRNPNHLPVILALLLEGFEIADRDHGPWTASSKAIIPPDQIVNFSDGILSFLSDGAEDMDSATGLLDELLRDSEELEFEYLLHRANITRLPEGRVEIWIRSDLMDEKTSSQITWVGPDTRLVLQPKGDIQMAIETVEFVSNQPHVR